MTIPVVPPAPAPAPAAKKKLGRGPLIAIIAGGVVVLLVVVAGVFALVQTFLGGGQSATASAVAFPKSTLYWAEAAIEPSNGQKIEAFTFINELDAIKDAIEDSDLEVDLDDPTSNTDLKYAVWEFITDSDTSTIDTGVDYEKDIQPWLGSRISIGFLPTDDLENGTPPFIVAIEAKNTDAGIDTIEEFIDDLDVDVDTDVQARDGYVVIGVGDVDLDDVYDDGTLAQAEGFTTAASRAGEWGVASFYVDLGAVYALANEATSGDYGDVDYWEQQITDNYYSYVDDSAYEDYEDCSAYDSPENVGDEDYEDYNCNYYYEYDGEYYEYYDDFAEAWVEDNARDLAEDKVEEYEQLAEQQQKLVEKLEGTTAFVVARFTDGSFELSGQISGVQDLVSVKAGGGEEGELPASTIGLLSVSGIAESLDASLTDENLALYANGYSTLQPYASSSAPTREDVEDWFDESLGLDFPDDLSDLFGTKTELVVDGELDLDELEQGPSGIGDSVGSGAALVIISDDADATVSAWEDVIERAEDSSGEKLDFEIEQDGHRVVVSAGDYLETVLDPDERLGQVDAFRRALPAADKANSVFYLDVQQIVDLVDELGGSGMGDALEFLDGVKALGMSTTQTSDDSYSFVVRVTTEAE